MCSPAVAQSALAHAYPTLCESSGPGCEFQMRDDSGPPIAGEYVVLDKTAPVDVSTLADVHLAEVLAQRQPSGLRIVGKAETENIGIDKIVKNIYT